MTDMVTDTGMNIPEDITEDQFFEAGRFLAKIEHGMQWAIGDWYNRIPWGDKEAACEKAGLNYETAKTCGAVCKEFKLWVRTHNLTFKHHKVLAINDLDDDQRKMLLDKASVLDSKGKTMTVANLRKERDELLGRAPPEVPFKIQGEINEVLDNLPKSTTQKAKQAIKKVFNHMKRDFSQAVFQEAQKKTAEQREVLQEARQAAEKEKENFRNLAKTLDGLMTEEEFRLIRGCLHPDRAPADRRAQFGKAFDIFNRLERSVNRDMSKSAMEKRGWAA